MLQGPMKITLHPTGILRAARILREAKIGDPRVPIPGKVLGGHL